MVENCRRAGKINHMEVYPGADFGGGYLVDIHGTLSNWQECAGAVYNPYNCLQNSVQIYSASPSFLHFQNVENRAKK